MYSDPPKAPDNRPGNGAGRQHLEHLRGAGVPLRPVPVSPLVRTIPPALSSSPGLLGILRGAQRHLVLILALGLLLAVPAAMGTWFLVASSKSKAEALLQVAATPPMIVFQTTDRTLAAGEFANYKWTQEVLLRSRVVLGTALRNPHVAELAVVKQEVDPVSWLAKNLRTSFTGEILHIGLEGENPHEVVQLVNAVIDAYLNEIVNVEQNRRGERLAELRNLSTEYQERLKDRRELLKKLAEAAGSGDKETLAFKHQLAMERLNTATQDFRRRRTQLAEAQMELAILDPQARAEGSPNPADDPTRVMKELAAAVEAAIERDATVQKYQAELVTLQNALQQYRRLAVSDADPSIRNVAAQFQSTRENLEYYRQRLRAQLSEQYLAARQPGGTPLTPSGRDDRVLLTRRIRVLEALETELAGEVEMLQEHVQSFNVTTLDLELLKNDILQSERTAERINQEVESLRVELKAPARIQLREKAEVAIPLSSKKRYVATAGAGGGTFALVLLGIGWLDARRRRVNQVVEVVHGLGMNLVGVLPSLTERTRRTPRRLTRGQDQFRNDLLIESVNATRAMLLHVLRSESVQTLMVASAHKGEGKTSLACHLATSLARAHLRTLLIDCDLRSPTVHLLFDQPRGPGLSEVLRGEAELADVIQPTVAPGLTLIAAGHCDIMAIESLAQGNLQGILDQLRQEYDYVIVDSAPILAVSDSLHICQHVDAVLFSVLRDVSRLPKIHEAYERLNRLRVKMLGAVVAGTRVENYYDSYADGNRAAAAHVDRTSSSSGENRS